MTVIGICNDSRHTPLVPFSSTELAARIERAESRMIEEGALAIRRRLPDVDIYVERLNALAASRELRRVRLGSPFVLRSVSPRLSEL